MAHPFEVGFCEAENLLNKTVCALEKEGANCTNVNVVMHDLTTVRRAVEEINKFSVFSRRIAYLYRNVE